MKKVGFYESDGYLVVWMEYHLAVVVPLCVQWYFLVFYNSNWHFVPLVELKNHNLLVVFMFDTASSYFIIYHPMDNWMEIVTLWKMTIFPSELNFRVFKSIVNHVLTMEMSQMLSFSIIMMKWVIFAWKVINFECDPQSECSTVLSV